MSSEKLSIAPVINGFCDCRKALDIKQNFNFFVISFTELF